MTDDSFVAALVLTLVSCVLCSGVMLCFVVIISQRIESALRIMQKGSTETQYGGSEIEGNDLQVPTSLTKENVNYSVISGEFHSPTFQQCDSRAHDNIPSNKNVNLAWNDAYGLSTT